VSETTQNPAEQDPDVRASRVRLYVFLALARLLAGRRGHSTIVWWGQGFRYTLATTRVDPTPYSVDADPDVEDRAAVIRWLQARLLTTHDSEHNADETDD
jgi:hypothetical protein